MDITYIYHSCFLSELADATFLFDYFKGTLPPIRKDKPLYILQVIGITTTLTPLFFLFLQILRMYALSYLTISIKATYQSSCLQTPF